MIQSLFMSLLSVTVSSCYLYRKKLQLADIEATKQFMVVRKLI